MASLFSRKFQIHDLSILKNVYRSIIICNGDAFSLSKSPLVFSSCYGRNFAFFRASRLFLLLQYFLRSRFADRFRENGIPARRHDFNSTVSNSLVVSVQNFAISRETNVFRRRTKHARREPITTAIDFQRVFYIGKCNEVRNEGN